MPYDKATALRAFLSSTPDLVYFFDLDGRFRFVGDAAAAALGCEPEAMIGHTFTEIGFAGQVSFLFDEQMREVAMTGKPIRDEATYQGPHGTAILEYVVAPVISEGESLGTVVVTRDVTERRQSEAALRESEAKFSVAFTRGPLALTITSMEDGRLVDVNDGFVKLSGYQRHEAVGCTPEELGLWVAPEVKAARFARLHAGEHVPDIEARFRVRNGEELIGVIASAVVEINHRRCVLSSVVDITERKLIEQAKDDFLATLSHELRTPLTSGYGWVKLLENNREPELLATGLRAIESSLVAQAKLIDDLLDVSRIAARALHLEMRAVDLGAVVESVVESVQPSAGARQIEIRVRTNGVLTVDGDPARLAQVLWNLLSNAIRFTPAGGVVDLELGRDGEAAKIVVRDTGEGIDSRFLPHVFDRFRQADSSISRIHGGLGIGLSIAASLVEAHHGSIEVESAGIGQGAAFTVRIPLIAGPAAQTLTPRVTGDVETNLTGIKVLLVDDDAAARQLMVTALGPTGAEVRECGTAAEALASCIEWTPHILVSDLAMPHEDGYSLIRRIRETGSLTPAVAVTAYARPEDEAMVLQAGFQRHLGKPFDPAELVSVIWQLTRA